ncbi:MAG: peptidase U32 family protein [Coriobacteriia bacterium]|nr:peptidase U32 family protein [Coriobacteriia bacterium]
MELLAPAGGIDQLRAAVRFGADAVYLATDRFGMRARASNFTLEDLPQAVAEAHAGGATVHVACNILMGQSDLPQLPAYFEALQDAGVDACIISDLGAFSLARKHAPKLELHVSTQASVANAEAARMWHDLGATRVVCAREMSLADIAEMRAQTPADLQIEAFAHGAMCMAVSGRCLISSYLTGRSANRGHCTQPCRWSYRLEEEKRPGEFFPVEQDENGTFIMNAKDMNMLAHLQQLRDAGVDSIKIEGRNKKAFYVASVVSAYRRVLDGADPADVAHELYDISHRPYGTGFFFDEAQQACDYDGYEQECVHVADVVGCQPLADGRWQVLTRCRNRWQEGDELEALVPRSPVRPLTVRNLRWHPEKVDAQGGPITLLETAGLQPASAQGGESPASTSGIVLGPDDGVSLGLGTPQQAEVANRSVALYSFESPVPVPAGSYLRIRKHHRTARHL